ncbi:hypothetical protein ACLMJK_004323 [Lecanora helva]
MPDKTQPSPMTSSRLPLEVICNVLVYRNDLDELTHVVNAAPLFLQAWACKPQTITAPLLKARGHGYDDARRLAKVQMMCPYYFAPLDVFSDRGMFEDQPDLFSLMTQNARLVDKAHGLFARYAAYTNEPNRRRPPGRIYCGNVLTLEACPTRFHNPTVDREFNHMYYCLWTSAIAAIARENDPLAHIGDKETKVLRTMQYIAMEVPTKYRKGLEMIPGISYWTAEKVIIKLIAQRDGQFPLNRRVDNR